MLKVSVIGRPNVGKSTLFNRLAGKKLALVHDQPGVTRDWREAQGNLFDLDFTVIDTAGVEEADKESLAGRMTATTKSALEQSDVALFVVDARAGLTGTDRDVASILRKSSKPIILIANKCDNNLPDGFDELHALGLGEPVAISAEHNLGMRDLYEALKPYIDGGPVEEEPEELSLEDEDANKPLHMAIIGRPNAGKSTLVNALVGYDRMLTGPEAGLTRDAVHIQWDYEGCPIRLVDTAGLRRNTKVHEKIEEMSVAETERAVRLAHIVVLVVDATEMFEHQDLHLAQMVEREGRGLVIAINKWDLVPNKEEVTAALRAFLDKNITQLPDIPIVMTTATKGQKLDKLMEAVFAMYEKWNKRISTSELNRWLQPLLDHHPPPLTAGRPIKIRYMTQIKTRPPTFNIWVNKPTNLPETYLRYLANDFRRTFDMGGVPLRLYTKKSDNPYVDD
ncbi:MAG: ribosome biogenesis GTPase Der [Alphaproteobacteria bacterium]|nr:ribosome biogenesis GTPase Der [Alphaproteobacteria bacterium]